MSVSLSLYLSVCLSLSLSFVSTVYLYINSRKEAGVEHKIKLVIDDATRTLDTMVTF
jgi:hypothetical protein